MQTAKRITASLTFEELKMLDWLIEETGEGSSTLLRKALRDYYDLKLKKIINECKCVGCKGELNVQNSSS